MKDYIELRKPIYGLYFGIRDKFLNDAIKMKTNLKVKYKEDTYLVNPKQWMKDAERIEKVYLIPDRPMILFANHLSKFPKEEGSFSTFQAMSKLAETENWEKLRIKLHRNN